MGAGGQSEREYMASASSKAAVHFGSTLYTMVALSCICYEMMSAMRLAAWIMYSPTHSAASR